MPNNFSALVHRHTPERVGPLELLGVPAPNEGRYHRLHEPRPLYASTTEQAAWKEAARKLDPPLLELVSHRMSRLRIRAAPLLDLTDEDTCDTYEVSYDELVGDDVAITQELADRARDAKRAGLLAPSAADRKDAAAATVVIFPAHLDLVRVESEMVRSFPKDLLP